ncbi:MAG: AAA family ATPase [Beijerinckiaceae bacterium]
MLDGRRKLPFSFAQPEETAPPPEPWRDGLDVGLILSKIRERKRLAIAGATLGALCLGACGAAWLTLRPTFYSAATEILITNTTLQLSGQDAVVTQLMVENTLLQSQILLARSNAVMDRTIAKVGMDRMQDMLPQPGLLGQLGKLLRFGSMPAPGSAQAQRARNAMLLALKSNVTVARVGASQIIGLRARGASPEMAAVLAQEVTQAFLGEARDINAVVTTSGAFRERIRVLGPTARVISEATPPVGKDGPRALLVLLLAPLLGGLAGCLLALARAVTSRRIWSGEQLTASTGGEFFGRIMASKHRAQESLHSGSSLAGSLRRIRTAAIERGGSRPRVIGITAMERGGKTTVAMGLALLLAGDGRRVLLVDAASATPDLTRRLDAGSADGLQQVLHDPGQFEEALQDALRPCLDMLPAGEGQSDLDTRWPNLLKAIDTTQKAYDWVILDMPMMDPAADLRAALCVLDDMVIVAERGVTSGPALSSALQALGAGRHKLLGTLINDPAHHQPAPAAAKASVAQAQKPVAREAVREDSKAVVNTGRVSRFTFSRERA